MLNVRIIFILNLLLLTKIGQSQVVQQSGSIYTEMASILSSMPGDSGNHYVAPSPAEVTAWSIVMNDFLAGNYVSAATGANWFGYQVIEFTDTFLVPNRTLYILKNNGTNYWGTYVYYPNYKRPLVIQSPHATRDFNTGNQGAYIFRETESMFYMLTGTHRCNSSVPSVCSGTTTACTTTSQPYPDSDLSHSVNSIFQKTTEILYNTIANSHFIQLHGFTKLSTDPYVILSNGTQVTPSPDYMSTFANNLYNEDTVLTFKIAHIDLSWTRLRGFWNTQSRMINGSTNACSANATTSQGRFFHIEQERQRLRQTSGGWTKVSNALINTFPATTLPVSVVSFEANLQANKDVLIEWITAQEINSSHFIVERSFDGSTFEMIRNVPSQGNSSMNIDYSVLDEGAKNLFEQYVYYRIMHVDLDGSKNFFNIEQVKFYDGKVNYSVSPNPSAGLIRFNTLRDIKSIAVYNHMGQNIYSENMLDGLELNMLRFASGIYHIILYDKSNNRFILKFSLK